MTSDHEIPLAVCILKGISGVCTWYSTGLLLINDMTSDYWARITGEKTQPLLVVTYCYQCSNWPKLTPGHEIPLAICLRKGISCVSTHYNTGLLLFYNMSSKYWAVASGEKNTACFGLLITVTSIDNVLN
jgi:hypothetical protein